MTTKSVTRILTYSDALTLENFLEPHTPSVYFLRSNAKTAGLVYNGKPYEADYFGSFEEGQLKAVIAHTWIGSVLVFIPEPLGVAPLVEVWCEHLTKAPRFVECFLGPAQHVSNFLSGLSLTDSAFRGNRNAEWLYTLELCGAAQFKTCETQGQILRRAESKDIDLLTQWRHDFYVEALGDEPGLEAFQKAHQEAVRRVGERDLFVLEVGQDVVSYCGAGGFLSDWKMIGPVWTPPHMRSKGYARAVVGGALHILRDEGARHAVLFSQNPYAEKAYKAIGFKRMGDWRLNFLKKPTLSLSAR